LWPLAVEKARPSFPLETRNKKAARKSEAAFYLGADNQLM